MSKIAFANVLGISSFRSLWLAQLFSQIGINLTAFVMALRVYELTHRNTAVSILTLAIVIPAAVFGMVAGVLVDRYDKKRVLFWCNVLRAVVALGFVLTSQSLFFIYILAILISFITQFFIPAEAPTISVLVPKEKLLVANGLFTVTIFVTMLAGGLLAGPMLTVFGVEKTLIFISLMFVLAGFFVSRIVKELPKNGHKDGLWREFTAGKDYLLTHRRVLFAVLLLVGSQTIIASSSNLLPGFADSVLHLAINDASVYLLGPAILGIVAGAFFVSQFGKKFRPKMLVDRGIFFVGLAVLALGVFRNLVFVQAVLFFLGFSNALVDVSANTILQSGTKEDVRSRIYGIQTTLSGLSFIFPMVVAGGFSDLFGVDRVFLTAGGLLLIFWLFKIRKYVARFA